MCLAVPMKLVELIDPTTALVELSGVRREIDVSMITDPAPGDFIIVHAGFALEKLDQSEAEARLKLFSDMLEPDE